MKIYDTSTADLNALSEREVDYIYNGLDCCITHELVDKLRLKLEPKTTGQICRFTGALQNICLDMTLTGIRIDPVAKQKVILETEKKRDEAQALLDELSLAFYGQTINPKSTKQCAEFFYGFLGIPPQYKRGTKGPTTDDAALEKLRVYF